MGPHERLALAQEVRRLYRAISETLQDAVKYRGSSLADEQYVDLFGKPGEYQHHHQVYAREGVAVPALPPRVSASATPTARRSTATRARSERTAASGTGSRDTVARRSGVFVTGRVQGVWFRESCREQAARSGVSGFVRNLSDGRVEAVFEGPRRRSSGWSRGATRARPTPASTGSRCRSSAGRRARLPRALTDAQPASAVRAWLAFGDATSFVGVPRIGRSPSLRCGHKPEKGSPACS